jgi:hypothetical protein
MSGLGYRLANWQSRQTTSAAYHSLFSKENTMQLIKSLSRAVVLNIILTVLLICAGHAIFYYFG